MPKNPGPVEIFAPALSNMAMAGKSPFSIGHTSSFMVDVLLSCYISGGGGVTVTILETSDSSSCGSSFPLERLIMGGKVIPSVCF